MDQENDKGFLNDFVQIIENQIENEEDIMQYIDLYFANTQDFNKVSPKQCELFFMINTIIVKKIFQNTLNQKPEVYEIYLSYLLKKLSLYELKRCQTIYQQYMQKLNSIKDQKKQFNFAGLKPEEILQIIIKRISNFATKIYLGLEFRERFYEVD